jgi:hypothetical protein
MEKERVAYTELAGENIADFDKLIEEVAGKIK